VAVERRSDPAGGGPMARGLSALDTRVGQAQVDGGLVTYETRFPALPVYRDEVEAGAWLARDKGDVPGREAALEELALTSIAAHNPAAAAYRELTSDPSLSEAEQKQLLEGLSGADLDADDPESDRKAPARTLMARLLEPVEAAPQSLGAQLRWIRINWAGWLDDADLLHIDRQLGVLDEIDRIAWLQAQRRPGSGDHADAAALSGFGSFDEEPEAFSEDRDWMAELVLVAKSTYVWLSQLSRQYERDIIRLDQVPDEELDEIRARGFTGLWMIGLWERSHASRRIKQMRGNSEAMASAYSVADYRIADELGGDEAWANLRERAAARGIRLAADMVPNHMGITGTPRMPRWSSSASTRPAAKSATSTTATTAPVSPGMTPPSSTTSMPTFAKRSSGRSSRWPVASLSSASMPPWSWRDVTSSDCGTPSRAMKRGFPHARQRPSRPTSYAG